MQTRAQQSLCTSRLLWGLELYLHEAKMAPLRHAAQAPKAERSVAATRHPEGQAAPEGSVSTASAGAHAQRLEGGEAREGKG